MIGYRVQNSDGNVSEMTCTFAFDTCIVLFYIMHNFQFLQTFDKNSDGIVSETEMTTRAELAFKVIE